MATNAFDGDLTTKANSICNTLNKNSDTRWIKLDFVESYKIGKVTIWQEKTNSFRKRMDNAVLSAGDVKCGTLKIRSEDDQRYEMDCKGAEATSVMLSVEPDADADLSLQDVPCIHLYEIQVESARGKNRK